MGDFNTDLNASPVLQAAVASGDWHDVAARLGDTAPTYNGLSRIDLIFGNRTATDAAVKVLRPAISVPGHAATSIP